MKAKVFLSLADPGLAAMILQGGVGVIPTDTVYGLVAKATHKAAVDRLYRHLQPGTIIGADSEDLCELGFDRKELDGAKKYWPNSVSVVLSATNIEPYLKKRRTALPVRIPSYPPLAALLETTGPLMTTSANAPGQPTATTIAAAMHYFGDDVDFYVDAGDLGDRPPSTIIGFDDNKQIVVYRQGAVDISSL